MKPELVDYGGNAVADGSHGAIVQDAGCAIITTSNDLGRMLHRVYGTSFAAPRVTNIAVRVLDKLRTLRDAAGNPLIPSSNLLRALLANSARCDVDWVALFGNKSKREKFDWQKACGYGRPDFDMAVGVQDNRAILIYQGSVEIDNIVYFPIPVPESLRKVPRNVEKRMRVSMAYGHPWVRMHPKSGGSIDRV